MEYLDIYDENGNYIGVEKRDIVHKKALWHNTVHCWLYDKEGNIYFQIRKDENKLYTTASGHIIAGETIKEGFGREVEEELGIKVNYNEAILVDIVKFSLDKIKKDGSCFKDRAFANVYVCEFNRDNLEFNFDEDELNGEVILKDTIKKETIKFSDFLVNNGETAIGKYGDVLNKIVELV